MSKIETPLWWLSFCDPDKPEGSTFLGVCIVPAHDMITAVAKARRLGCNPGGEVLGHPLEDEVDPKYIGTLMSRAELAQAGLILTS
jgi:hypothetical protein